MPPSHTGGLKVSLQLPLQLKSLQTTGGTSGDKVFNALSLLAMPHVGDIRSKKSPLLRKPHPATRGKIFYRKTTVPLLNFPPRSCPLRLPLVVPQVSHHERYHRTGTFPINHFPPHGPARQQQFGSLIQFRVLKASELTDRGVPRPCWRD